MEKEYFFIIFSIVCIYLYFRNFPDKYLTGLLILLPLAGIVQIIVGVLGFTMPWHNLSHITGAFGNTGLFGGFATLGLVVCIGMIHSYTIFKDCHCGLDPQSTVKGIKSYLKSFILFIFGVLSIPLALQVYASGSRASWIAVLGAIVFLLIRRRIISWLLLVLFLPVFFICSSKYLYDLKKDSADGRLLIAKVSLNMVEEAPAFGSGISGFKAGYLKHQANYFRSHSDSPDSLFADDVETPFNEFLKILIEQGITGLLLFFCVLYGLFERKNMENTHPDEKLIIAQSVVLSILIFGLFSYPFDKLPFTVLFVLSLTILSRNRNPVFTVQMRKISYLRIPVIIAFCLVCCKVAYNAHSYSKSCRRWNRALMNFGSGKEESLSLLKKLYPELSNNPVFLTTYGKALNLSEHYQEAARVLEKAVERFPLSTSYIELGKSYEASGFPEKAFSCWQQAGWTVPSRFAPLYLTMKLHFKNGEYDAAKACAEQLLAKKIKIDNPEIDSMKRTARDILNFHPPP